MGSHTGPMSPWATPSWRQASPRPRSSPWVTPHMSPMTGLRSHPLGGRQSSIAMSLGPSRRPRSQASNSIGARVAARALKKRLLADLQKLKVKVR